MGSTFSNSNFDTLEKINELIKLRNEFIHNIPKYPEGKFSGRGAVILADGAFEAGAYVAVMMLRATGWTHPIHIWTRHSAGGLSPVMSSLPGVYIINADKKLEKLKRRNKGAWESKLVAILECPFEEVLFIDADVCVTRDVNSQFNFIPTGWGCWPDIADGDANLVWRAYGFAPDGSTGINGGHYVIRKKDAWRRLQLACWLDDHIDFYYYKNGFAYGDQESPRVAARALGESLDILPGRPESGTGNVFVQFGFDDIKNPLFVHRYGNKLAPPLAFKDPPKFAGDLPREREVWKHFKEWTQLVEPAAPECISDKLLIPKSIPTFLTSSELLLIAELSRGRDFVELDGFEGAVPATVSQVSKIVFSNGRDYKSSADWLARLGLPEQSVLWGWHGDLAADVALVGECPWTGDTEILKRAEAVVRPGGLVLVKGGFQGAEKLKAFADSVKWSYFANCGTVSAWRRPQ